MLRIYAFFSVNFSGLKMCDCKKMTNIRYGLGVFLIYFRMIGFSFVFLYSFNCSSHYMFLSIRMIFLRPLGILIGNHLSFNLPSGHAIRFFRLSNIDASWPDIFYRMSLLKWDMAVNSCLIAQSTCRHNHGLKRSKIFLWYTQLDI